MLTVVVRQEPTPLKGSEDKGPRYVTHPKRAYQLFQKGNDHDQKAVSKFVSMSGRDPGRTRGTKGKAREGVPRAP